MLPNYKVAYFDESGSFGYDFDKPGTTPYFIVCAIIADPKQEPILVEAVQNVKKNEKIEGELKSSSIGSDYRKRFRVLQAFQKLQFHVVYTVIDKKKIYPDTGLAYKPSFIKYSHNILYRALKNGYESLKIIAHEHGTSEFMESFKRYVMKHSGLFNPYEFEFGQTDKFLLLQLADFIAGTIALGYKEEVPEHYKAYLRYLREKIIYSDVFPKDSRCGIRLIDRQFKMNDFDERIAYWCLKIVNDYIEEYEASNVPLQIDRLVVLNRLLFQLQIEPTMYISAPELRRVIKGYTGRSYTRQKFSHDIIGPLRDNGVIIASTEKGYKIPLNINEIHSYCNLTLKIVGPMLDRLETCRRSILLGTRNELDIMDVPEYSKIKAYFDMIGRDSAI